MLKNNKKSDTKTVSDLICLMIYFEFLTQIINS